MWVRDRPDGLWRGEDFARWYPRDGRPGLSPAQLATVCALQFLLDLSDRQAAEAVRCRIDSTYALAMELDDPGFHHSVPADVRERLIEGDRADRLLDLTLMRLKETCWQAWPTRTGGAVMAVRSDWARTPPGPRPGPSPPARTPAGS